jgi:SAM-dependent methyltransferase
VISRLKHSFWGLVIARPRATHLLRVPIIRFIVAWVRYRYFVATRGIKTYSHEGDVGEKTVEHNLRGLIDLAVVRSEMLLRPLSVIESIPRNARVLAVGPRTEGELLNLLAHGFKKANVRGLDLISYSPWIDLGDLHDMPYDDNSWDVIVLGWILAYSDNWEKAAQEVIRVARPGAVVAIGAEYNPLSNEEIVATYGYRVGNRERLTSVDQILGLFGDSVDAVYFKHDIVHDRRNELGGVATVFSLRKEPRV